MPRPYANDPQRLDRALSPGLLRVLLIGFGIALLIGLTSGAVWIAYDLLRLDVFR